MPQCVGFDHLVLTVHDIDATVAFYTEALGMRAEQFDAADGTRRRALRFGSQKINLHPAEAPFLPHAKRPTAGSADICLLTSDDVSGWIAHLGDLGIDVEAGPVPRTGAAGPLVSIYVRDPDGNLVEISQPG